MAWRRLTIAVIAPFVAWLLLAMTAAVALAVPPRKTVPGYPAPAPLDARRPTTGYAPLSQNYLNRVLGLNRHGKAGRRLALPSAPKGSTRVGRASVTHAFTNDSFSDAYPIPNIPFKAHTDTRAATRQPGEPASCSRVGGTAWYRYSPSSDVPLFADTFGTNYPTALAVFDGTSLSDLASMGCNTGTTGNAQVGLSARRGHTYFFQVTGPARGGSLVFELTTLGRTENVGHPAEEASISADGRYLAFTSTNYDLDEQRSDNEPARCVLIVTCMYVYVHDRNTRTTTMVSVGQGGELPNDVADEASISANGRFVAYRSGASNLVPNDTNGLDDIFVFDRLTRTTTRESVGSSGEQARSRAGGVTNYDWEGSGFPHLSGDGRYVTFYSDAPNFGPSDGCVASPAEGRGCAQAYLRDRLARTTTLISAGRRGAPEDGDSLPLGVSADGRFVVFVSAATDWGNPNPTFQVYLWDRDTRSITLVSRSIAGGPCAGVDLYSASISSDGNRVAFQADAGDLVVGDTNAVADAFAWERATGIIRRVSVTSEGGEATDPNRTTFVRYGRFTSLSADGRLVAFDSSAANLVPGDTNGQQDVFVHDVATGATRRVSVSSTGDQGNGVSRFPTISGNGSVVAFDSTASTLGGDRGGVFTHTESGDVA